MVLNENGTFLFNKNYPFLYDSAGIWIPRKPGLDQWNLLIFNKRSYIDNESLMDCQFADSWKMGSATDSTLMLNSMTPQKGQRPLHIIFFKKIQRSSRSECF